MAYRKPCDEHFETPCIVYREGEKDCQRVEHSHFYDTHKCENCGWMISVSKPVQKIEIRQTTISYSGKVYLPEHLKQKFIPSWGENSLNAI
jgi:hypothetical protein